MIHQPRHEHDRTDMVCWCSMHVITCMAMAAMIGGEDEAVKPVASCPVPAHKPPKAAYLAVG